MKAIILTSFILGIISSSINAATINFDESISGDLGFPQSFVFDVGINTIQGSIGLSIGSTPGIPGGFDNSDIIDDFLFEIPDNLQLISATIEFTEISIGPFASDFSPVFFLNANTQGDVIDNPSAALLVDGQLVQPLPLVLEIDSSLLPIGPGVFLSAITANGSTLPIPPSPPGFDPAVDILSLSFQADFNVAPVPLPATAWLFLTGIGFLIRFRSKSHFSGLAVKN